MIPMKLWAVTRTILLAVLGAAVLVSCTVTREPGGVDTESVEAKLVEEQEKKTPDIEVEGASCPEDVGSEDGDNFECTVTLGGVEVPYTVTIQRDDPDSDTAQFHMEPTRPIIDTQLVVDFLTDQLNKRSQGADVECGDERVVVTDVGGTITCTVSKGAESTTVDLVVKDKEGTVGFAE